MKLTDSIAGSIGIGISIYVFYVASGFPEDQVIKVGPAFFPQALSVGLGVFSIVLLVLALKGKSEVSTETFSLKDPGIQRAGISVLATALFCLALNTFGFLLCSFIYIFFLSFLMKDRRYLEMAVVSAAVTAAVYLVFKAFLDITLPLGTLYGF